MNNLTNEEAKKDPPQTQQSSSRKPGEAKLVKTAPKLDTAEGLNVEDELNKTSQDLVSKNQSGSSSQRHHDSGKSSRRDNDRNKPESNRGGRGKNNDHVSLLRRSINDIKSE